VERFQQESSPTNGPSGRRGLLKTQGDSWCREGESNPPEQSQQGKGILVVGNPAFDQAGKVTVASTQQAAPSGVATGTNGTLLRSTRSACGTFQSLHFSPLPGSQQDAENIAAIWKLSGTRVGAQIMRGSTVQPESNELLQMSGAEASPEAFEQFAPGKRVLHVATHGFSLEGSCESAVQRRLDPSKRDASILPATAVFPTCCVRPAM